MPSTYTDNGGIELPANGEQSSTWGNTINDNMNIIDRLTNGVGAITLSGTTHTLTTSDGTPSDGHYKVLVLGGSPSGTNTVTVAPNNGQHIYIVKNGSGQTATFTQGSGANVSVKTSTTKIIYCDGAGSAAAVVDITGSLDLGSLVVGGTTVTATVAELNIMDGVTATTAELNIMDGVTSSTAEINKLDGFTGVVADLNYAKDLRGTGVTTAEFDVLDGVTATTAELNIMDGVTATTAEINYIDGVTSSVQTQVNAKASNTTQATSVWQAGTGTTDSIVSPAKVKAAIVALTEASPIKAWARFSYTNNSANATIQASDNIASINYVGTGEYQVAFTNNLADANYVVLGNYASTNDNSGSSNDGQVKFYNIANTGCRVVVHHAGGQKVGSVYYTSITFIR